MLPTTVQAISSFSPGSLRITPLLVYKNHTQKEGEATTKKEKYFSSQQPGLFLLLYRNPLSKSHRHKTHLNHSASRSLNPKPVSFFIFPHPDSSTPPKQHLTPANSFKTITHHNSIQHLVHRHQSTQATGIAPVPCSNSRTTITAPVA